MENWKLTGHMELKIGPKVAAGVFEGLPGLSPRV